MFLASITALLLVISGAHAAANSNIDHFVVLMLENRAFDHMCGWLKRDNPEINGLTGTEFNTYNGVKHYVNDTCPYVNPFDPDHSFAATTFQLMGQPSAWINPAPMSGFVAQAASLGHTTPEVVMSGFSPERVPAISTLAKEFAIFDEYFASFPGETLMNRLFFNMGSSDSYSQGDGNAQLYLGYNGTTMYDFFNAHNVTWKAYYEDVSDLLYMRNPRNISDLLEKFTPYNLNFAKDAAAGTLPQFSWVSPRFYPDFNSQPRDQHPDHDVVEGERMIAEVYAALRSSPKWNRTALLLTYDEHGGLYDHVSPPSGVPNPMPGMVAQDDPLHFNFTRAGVRVCTVLASPWIPKGQVVHGPANGAGSAYEATSIFNTLKNLFGYPDEPLTPRQAWAAPYDWLLNMNTAPRTDCPMTLPVPPEHTEERFQSVLTQMQTKQPNGLQKELYVMVEGLHGRDGKDVGRFATQLEMGTYITEQHRAFLESKTKH